jgi:GNAT superfamily N-acetyltransferase
MEPYYLVIPSTTIGGLTMTQVRQQSAHPAPQPTVRKVTAADRQGITAAMARAFDDDPFANWFAAQDGKRSERIAEFLRLALEKFTLPFGECYTTDDIEGGAYWNPPGTWKLGLLQQLMMTPDMARVAGWRRLPKIIDGIAKVEKRHPEKPHFYLLALGVEPELQGRGIGGRLMQPVLERCDREGIPAYLESSKERNVPLYERNGFEVTEVFQVPHGGPPIWLMWRDPR